ncbi:MAG: Hsp20/alpha crystallin family protein [bacterium]
MDVIKKIGIRRGLEDMQDQMERMMEEVAQHLSRSFFPRSSPGFAPPMDLYETPEEILILVEMAGMRSEEIQVIMDRGVLRISGVRTNPVCDPQRRVHQMEIDFGPFERSVRIRVPVQEEKIQAVYRDGFLMIRVPKGPELSREILVK